MKVIVNILLSVVALYLCAYLFETVVINDVGSAILAAIILGILTVTIKPILKLLTLPLNLITFGLFSFILNGIILYLVAILTPGFDIASFWWAILVALVVTFSTTILQNLLGTD